MRERRSRDPRHQNVAGCDAGQLALAIDHHRAARAPADAGGMAVEAGVLEPDLVRHMRRLDLQRPCLQQLETFVVECPFDLDRAAEDFFRLADEAPERHRLSRVEARRTRQIGRHRLRRSAEAVHAGLAMVFAPGLDLAQEA